MTLPTINNETNKNNQILVSLFQKIIEILASNENVLNILTNIFQALPAKNSNDLFQSFKTAAASTTTSKPITNN